MGVKRRNVVSKPVRQHLKAARERSRASSPAARDRPIRIKLPPVPEAKKVPEAKAAPANMWRMLEPSDPRAQRAVRVARQLFGPRGVDAVLGWFFSRFPELGQQGDDMVNHHAGLRDDGYYLAWVAFCRRMELLL